MNARAGEWARLSRSGCAGGPTSRQSGGPRLAERDPNRGRAVASATYGAVLALTAVGLCSLPAVASEARLEVQVGQPGHRVAPTLWGIFFEDINLSADGGIYPELVRNRSFEDAETPEHWSLVTAGGASAMRVDNGQPLNPFNRRSLRLRVEGETTLENRGYWGMNVQAGQRYRVRLAARSADGLSGPLTVRLRGGTPDGELARGEITGFTDRWKEYTVELTATGTDPKARLNLEVSGQGTLWLDMVSVLPAATWKGHGLRSDLGEMLAALKPAFLRFPGGCWVEGDDLAHMYNWKRTSGEHYDNNPEFFMQQAGRYDTYDRDGPNVFVGEYAVTSGAGLGNLRGAIGEAAFMTGLERNSDVVVMAAYAPLLVNVNHKRWPINLVNFDSSRAFGLPSYYVQQMFSAHRGDVVLPVAVQAPETETGPRGGANGEKDRRHRFP